MPRNPKSPRASEVHWLSVEEKEEWLKSLGGESFSNYVRRLIGLPPLAHGGTRMTRYVIVTRFVWVKSEPDKKLRVRAVSSHSACVAAAKHWGRPSINGLCSMVDFDAPQQVVVAPKMPAAEVLV